MLLLAQQMPFEAVARLAGISAHWVTAICSRCVELALATADFSEVTALAIDETSRARGHNYVTLAADANALKDPTHLNPRPWAAPAPTPHAALR